mgnify:CR=1 FL=1
MKPAFYLFALLASAMIAMTSGCASGGYKLTRQYARWLNSQQLILRIILYILTSVVFVVTIVIDSVIFNTMDFWEGRVSAGDYEFKKDGKTYYVKHEVLPESGLKRSSIQVTDTDGSTLQNLVLAETANKEIELYVDGKLRARVRDIESVPTASLFDRNGTLIDDKFVLPVAAPQTQSLAAN